LNEAGPGRAQLAWLGLTATVSGALVMVVEIMGARVIGPFFGMTIHVWTALISVTLIALSLGYAIGGALADRRPSADVLFGLLFFAGIASLSVPLLRAPVVERAAAHGLRLGAFLSALALFGPLLLLLGCVTPYVVRLAARGMERLGRTVGAFYALSTLGSVAGSLLTGYWLIERFGVRGVFLLAGATLIALSAAYFALFRRVFVALALLALPAFVPPDLRAGAELGRASDVTRLERREGLYGTLQVLEYRYGTRRVRSLVLDGLTQSGMDVDERLSVYEYTYHMQFLPRSMRPEGRTALAIGLGAGLIPGWYAARGVRTDVVEINPEVARLARDYFGFRTDGSVYLADARRFLAEPGPRYDYILMDAFGGDSVPSHLLSLECLRLLGARLERDGVLALNLIGGVGEDSLATAAVVRTLEEVFPTVELYPAFDAEPGGSFGNVIVIARHGSPLAFNPRLVRRERVHAHARGAVERFLGRRWPRPRWETAPVLTDDRNPLDVLDLWAKEGLRRRVLRAMRETLL
jgi:spermidine synthase